MLNTTHHSVDKTGFMFTNRWKYSLLK